MSGVALSLVDPNEDNKGAIVEIHARAGGEEARLWAGDLFEMYRRLAERHGWKTVRMSSSGSDRGGFDEVVLELHAKDAYARLRHEAGVHRVQRVPVTESQGRIYTATATVAVMPVPDARSEKIRTYNFPEGRVTDHRINHTSHNLQDVLGGGPHLDGFIDRLLDGAE